jgi:hypothetical protein
LKIEGIPGAGTTLTLRIPLRRPARGEKIRK